MSFRRLAALGGILGPLLFAGATTIIAAIISKASIKEAREMILWRNTKRVYKL